MSDAPWGERLPQLATPIPGPQSQRLARRLQRVESRNITAIGDAGPVFWSEAAGSNVRDVDGNVYIDLTAGFGVSAAGHGNPVVARAAARQLQRLPHAMGDVYPADVKVQLLERLAVLAPGNLSVSILSANGSDAVESALKTALLATGRPGVVAFSGGYHGLGYGALSVTSGARFRDPFRAHLFGGVHFVHFPVDRPHDTGAGQKALEAVREVIVEAGMDVPVGAVIVEPIQGRGGIVVPPADFLPGLRALCTELDVLLILDEIYTGLGRTGHWFACQHWGVVPDLLVLGKSLAGGLPLSAVVGAPAVMNAWPVSDGEAIHTSTFLGNPVTCAAALAQLGELDARGLVDRAAILGDRLADRLDGLVADQRARSRRGLGLMQALDLAGPVEAGKVSRAALREGIMVLPEGAALAFTPPLTITESQLDFAVDVVEGLLAGASR